MVQKPESINPTVCKKTSDPLCSVCIANFNGEKVLPQCLDSVYAQQCSFAFEVLVHDDASTDGSLALLDSRNPQPIIIASNRNVGFCISNNRMVQKARGRYILLLNNDAALEPDALQTLFNHSQKQSPQGILTLPQYDWRTGELVDRGCLLDPFFNPVPNLDPERTEVAMAIGACLWIPRSLWHRLDGFPEWMGSIAEDMYLCCLARLYGYPVEVTQSSGYRHWQGKSFSGERTQESKLASTFRRRFLSERNKTFTMIITCPEQLLSIIFPIHIIALCLEGIAVSILRKDSRLLTNIYLRLPHSVWIGRMKIRKTRHQVHSNRVISSSGFLSGFRWIPWKLNLLLRFGVPIVR